ncbi:MAG: hypothetical protein ABIH41_04195 [Nanoarchaeota archaeon]
MVMQDVVFWLKDEGVMDVLIPFILVFTLVFAVLQRTKILGAEKYDKRYNTLIALVMGLAVVVPHVTGSYPMGYDVVDIINNALPQVSLVIVAIVMLLIIIGAFGHEMNIANSPVGGWVVILAVLFVAAIFGNAAGWFRMPGWLRFIEDPETQTIIVVILVFALIVAFITHEPGPTKEHRFIDNWKDMLSGGPKQGH